jgi:hypothetical protein
MTVSSVRLKPSNFYTFLIAIFLCVCAYNQALASERKHVDVVYYVSMVLSGIVFMLSCIYIAFLGNAILGRGIEYKKRGPSTLDSLLFYY